MASRVSIFYRPMPMTRWGRAAATPPSVPRDGPGSWYTPESLGQFSAIGAAVPDYLLSLQEASGSILSTDSQITLAANATGHLYRQSVAGWARYFLGLDGSTAGQAWRTTTALLDLALGESYAVYALLSATTPGTSRSLLSIQGANNLGLIEPTTGFPRLTVNNVGASGAIAMGGLATVHQFCWYRNALTNVSGLETDLESVTTTHNENALTGQIKGIGPPGATTPPAARFGQLAIYKGANAERNWAAELAVLRG